MKKLKLGVVTDALALGAGAVAGNKLANIKLPISLPPIVQPLIPVAAGIFLSTRKNRMVQMVGYGMIASGVIGTAKIALPQLGLGELSDAMGDFVIDDSGMNGSLALAGPGTPGGGVALAGFGSRSDQFNSDLMAA